MISPKLYKSSRTYDFFMKSLGYENSITRFLNSLPLDCAPDCRILDVGCGTGVLGLHFLERFPQSRLIATDLEPNFLQATLANAGQRHIDVDRITVGVGNVSRPTQIHTPDGERRDLEHGSFDLISMGAVVGYAQDTEASIRELLALLAPGGSLINVEMSESITGRFVSRRYHYHNISLSRMQDVIRAADYEVSAIPLSMNHLPAKLTRIGIVARKR